MNFKNGIYALFVFCASASYSEKSCRGLFEPKAFKKKIRALESSEHTFALLNFLESLKSEDILNNLSHIKPDHVRIFKADQLRPSYGKAETTADGYFSLKQIRSLANKEKLKYYGPLPHFPPHFVPELNPKTITNLGRSIRYLEDKVEYMTKEQIQALSLDQIRILAKTLKKTGKNEELSQKQVAKIINTNPYMFQNLLESPVHNEVVAKRLFDNVMRSQYSKENKIDHIRKNMVNNIPLNKLSLDFLDLLRRKSYTHFLAFSPERISDMKPELQEYIARARWDSYLRKPQKSFKFRNLSVEKFKEMEPADKKIVLTELNLSKELFMKFLDSN